MELEIFKNKHCGKRLVVMLSFELSPVLEKGEVLERYFNPGNFFKEVHIVLLNYDCPDKLLAQKMAGDCDLHIHNVPISPWLQLMALCPIMFRFFSRKVEDLVLKINPEVIRCYGADMNIIFSRIIFEKHSIPYVVSLHNDILEGVFNLRDGFFMIFYKRISDYGLKKARLVLPVYKSILKYLDTLSLSERSKVCYNVLNDKYLRKKESYDWQDCFKIISVGRQIKGKDVSEIIKAISELENVSYTLVGHGELNQKLKELVRELNVADRVQFIPAMSNDEVAACLKDYDLFATHCDYSGISKAVLEPMLVGLPILMNICKTGLTSELQEAGVKTVKDQSDEYKSVIKNMMEDNAAREEYGRHLYQYAQEHFAPEKTELAYVDIYKSIVGQDG